MRKAWIWIVVLLLSLALTACGSSSPSGSDTTGTSSANKSEQVGEGTLDKYAVKFTGASLAKDYDGNDVIIVSYDFTNNSEENASAMISLLVTAFQDGVELEHAYFIDAPDGYNSDNQMKDLKTGATLNCQEAYILSNTTSPVEVEAKASFSLSSDKVIETFQIAE